MIRTLCSDSDEEETENTEIFIENDMCELSDSESV